MSDRLFLILLLRLVAINAAFEEDCALLNTGTVRSVYRFGSCFVIDSSVNGKFDQWRSVCNQMGAGHLAVVNSWTVAEALWEFMAPGSVKRVFISLKQFDTSLEPDGNWEFDLPNGTVPARHIPWTTGEPNNWGGNEHCGALNWKRWTNDFNCRRDANYLCQYKNPSTSGCFDILKQTRFSKATRISDEGILVPGKGGRQACGRRCNKNILCFGFTIKLDDGHCWTHQDDGRWDNHAPEINIDFESFVKI